MTIFFMDNKKPIPREVRSLAMKLEKCQNCNRALLHDFYTEEERKSRNMNLGSTQRTSFCTSCQILYINSKL